MLNAVGFKSTSFVRRKDMDSAPRRWLSPQHAREHSRTRPIRTTRHLTQARACVTNGPPYSPSVAVEGEDGNWKQDVSVWEGVVG